MNKEQLFNEIKDIKERLSPMYSELSFLAMVKHQGVRGVQQRRSGKEEKKYKQLKARIDALKKRHQELLFKMRNLH